MIVTTAVVLAVAVLAARLRPTPRRAPAAPAPTNGGDATPRRSSVPGRVAGRFDTLRRRPSTDVEPADVAEWCEALAREVRSGTSLHESVAGTEPNADAMAHVVSPHRHRLARGEALVDAVRPGRGGIDGTGHGAPEESRDVRLALDVIAVCSSVGGSAAAALDRTAAALRQRAADRSERRAQAAQARLSAHVLTVLPLAMLSLLLAVDGDVRSAVATPVGAAVIVAGSTLNGVGWLWMRAVVARGGR